MKVNKVKQVISIMLVVLMLGTLSACSGNAKASDSDKQIIIRMTHTQQPDSISDKTAKEFQRLVAEKSDDRIRVEIYQNCGLSGGDLTKAIELVQAGNIDIHACAPPNIANYDSRFYAFWLPYMFDDTQELVDFCNNKNVRKEINGWCEDLEMEMLGLNSAGARQISSNKEIRTPEDLKGMNIRVPGANVFITLYKDYFHANPTAMDFSEVYTALQQGTIDGQENPIAVFESSKFSEVQKDILMWDGIQDTNIWLMSQKTLKKLSKEDADIIKGSATEALDWGNEYLADNEKELISELEKKGVKFTYLNDEEKQQFKDVCEKMVDSYEKVIGKDVVDLFRNHGK